MRRWLMLIGLLASVARAQTASLRGVVSDPTGAVLAGAEVQLRGPGGQRRAKTDGSGRYVFAVLAAGKYQLLVNVDGFAPLRKNQPIDKAIVLDLRLRLAGQRQEVTVEESADGRARAADPGANGSAIVVRQRQIAALSDDPDELAQQLEALAGPAPGPMGGQIYIDGFLGGNLPPKSAIREVRVNSNPFSPEYDRPGFGRIEIFTKPGSDQFHGDFLAQYNNQFLNSRNPLLAQSTRPSYQVQLYQLNLAGPIKKNKASFTLNAEHREVRENALILATTTDGPLSQSLTTPLARTAVTPRVDYTLNAKNTLVVRYQDVRDEQDKQGAGGFNLPSRAYNGYRVENAVQATETAMIDAHTINETRFQFLRSTLRDTPDSLAPAIIVMGAFSAGGATVGNSNSAARSWELTNITSYIRGKHTLKWGGRARGASLTDTSRTNFSGAYTFYSLAAFQQGLPAQFSLNTGMPTIGVRQYDVGVFANDDWRVRSNLTLSYGLRYEAQTNYGDSANWAPRVALAWSPGAGRNPKTVLRAGAGTFYDRIPISTRLNALRYNGVAQQSYLILAPSFFPAIPAAGTLSHTGQPQQLQPVYSGIKNGRTYQASSSVERRIGSQSRITASYLYSRGVDLLNSRNVNAPVDGVYLFGNSDIRVLNESAGLMRLQQLIVNPALNFKRVMLFGYYVLSYGQDNNEGQPADPYNLQAEWGPSTWGDVRHKIVTMATVKLPWSSSATPFLVASSGQPFNITSGIDPELTGFPAARPALFATGSCQGAALLYEAGFGCFNLMPAPGTPAISRNSARGPATASLGLRVSRTWVFHGGIARDAAFPMHGGPGAGESATKGVTLSASTLNALNRTNLAPPDGDLSSPYFGQSLALSDLMGHMGKSSTYNRRIDVQVRFSF
jgi:hypothetical protein